MITSSRTLRLAFYLSRVAGINERVELLARKYPRLESGYIRTLVNYDPTGDKGDYLEWIVRQYSLGNFPWTQGSVLVRPSTFNKESKLVRDNLKKYDDIKKTPKRMKGYGLQPDINQYKTFESLKQAIDQLEGITSIVYDEPPYRIIKIEEVIGDPDSLKKAVSTACYYGKDTDWCTESEPAAQDYLQAGPLYIIFKNDRKYAQLSPKGGASINFELMDLNNDTISYEDDPDLYMTLKKAELLEPEKYLEFLIQSKDQNILTQKEKFSKDPELAYIYANLYLKGRFPEGETAIAQDAEYSYKYAKNVLKDKFPEGEPAMAKSYIYSYEYAVYVLNGPFPLGEPAIAEGATYSYNYAQIILKNRFPLGERAISKSSYYSLLYAKNIIKGSFPEGLQAMATDGAIAAQYAMYIGKRFPLGEPAIAKNKDYAHAYSRRFLNDVPMDKFFRPASINK